MFLFRFLLFQNNEINSLQADALLATEYAMIDAPEKPTIAQPQTINGNTVRIAQIYNKTLYLIADCLNTCGLKRFIVSYFLYVYLKCL